MRSEEQRLEATAVRNLDEIQEDDPSHRPSRAGALVLASLGGACIVFAAVALMRTPARTKIVNTDPLGDLVARARTPGAQQAPADDTIGHDVTFPQMLSDKESPTTAFERVRDPKAMASYPPFLLPAGSPTTPPAAADRLPVMPLPAQHVVGGVAASAAPGDTLSAMAKHVSRDDGAETAVAGTPGGFQLQVSSFKTAVEAEAFAAALRRRGHKAYVEPAQVKGRGLWHRVRIGPFKYRRSAVIYRQEFETKERMVTFIVDPPKVTVVASRLGAEDRD